MIIFYIIYSYYLSFYYFQYTPAFASTPTGLEKLPFGENIQLNGAFVLMCIYIGKIYAIFKRLIITNLYVTLYRS